MSCVEEVFIGDIGTSIEFLMKECDSSDPDNPVEVLVDVSTASEFQLIFIKPDSTTLTKTDPEVEFLTDGTDSIVRYQTIETDLDTVGTWKAQLRITMPTGKWYTEVISFRVNNIIS